MNCIMCGKNDKEILFRLSSNMKILSDSFKNTETFLVNCKCCGNTFVDIDATQDDFNAYYKSPSANALSYYECYGEGPTNKYFSDVLSKFKKYITKESNIIDIASGVGDFSQFLITNGYKNVTALDISERCCSFLDSKGIKSILSDTIHFDKSEEGKYDCAILLHSLEHYLDFKTAIEAVKKFIKKNGIIYVETPDAEKYCNVEAVPFTLFTYEHTFHLTKDTMRNLGRVSGLKLLDTNSFFKADSYWVVYGVFRNNGENKMEPIYTNTTKQACLQYIDFSKKLLAKRLPTLDDTEYYLWGIGASTALLLNETFDKYNIIGLIDRNPAKQGIEYKIGNKLLTISDPSSITNPNATILVLPYWYKVSIVKQIKEMNLRNKIITL